MGEMTQCERCGTEIEYSGAGYPVCSRECKGAILVGSEAVC